MASGEQGGEPSPLLRARQERGWSVKGTAARLSARLRADDPETGKSANVTPAMLREWERGYPKGCRPQARHRRQLCALYEMTEEQLGIDRASWPWPRHKPAKAAPRARRGDGARARARDDQAHMRYDPDKDTVSGRMDPISQAEPLIRWRLDEEEAAAMEREQFLRTMAALGLGATAESLGGRRASSTIYSFFASGPNEADRVLDASGVTEGTLADLEVHTGDLYRRWYATGFAAGNMAVLVALRAYLGTILSMVDRPELPAARRRLCAQAAQMNDLLRLASWDLDFHHLARRYGEAACKAGRQAEDSLLSAQILCNRAHLEVARFRRLLATGGNPAAARASLEHSLSLYREALTGGEKAANPWTTAEARSAEAVSYARLGLRAEAEASLEAGERAMEIAVPGDRPYPVIVHSRARFAKSVGEIYLSLGMPGLAQAAIRESLDLHGAAKSINRATGHLSLALACARAGAVDTALEVGGTACQLASELPVSHVRAHVSDLRLALVPHRHEPDVQQLDDRLSELAA